MKNDKDEISKFVKGILVTVVGAFVVVCVLNSIFLILPLFCKNIDGTKLNVQQTEISIFIAFLTLTLAITILVPYFISKEKVKASIIYYLENEYKTTILLRADEVTRTDSHLSRMIAFLLLQNGYYHWAIGWCFRSLKRYYGLDGTYQKIYKEFHGMIFNEIILKSLKKIASNEKDKAIENFTNPQEDFLIRVRAVKDFIDFEYDLEKGKYGQDFVRNLKKSYGDAIVKIKIGMLCVYANIYTDNSLKVDGKTNVNKVKENVDDKIINGSNYRNDNKFVPFYNEIRNACFLIKEEDLKNDVYDFTKYYSNVLDNIKTDKELMRYLKFERID